MTFTKQLTRFYQLGKDNNSKYSKDNILKLSSLFGNPHKHVNTIHVSGTNGKGSTCYKLAQVLIDNNIKTGMSISPGISSYRERIQFNNQLIPEDFVADFLPVFFSGLDKGLYTASFLEGMSIMAFKYFQEMGADLSIIEVGIGGRTDFTNILEKKALSIITSIGIDHEYVLGDTIEEVLVNKLGIAKPGTPLLIGPDVPQTIPRRLTRDIGSDLYITKEFKTGIGIFNAAENTVRSAVDILNEKYQMDLKIRDEVIDRNIAGRMEKVNLENLKHIYKRLPKSIILNVGHNYHAINHSLSNSPQFNKENLILLLEIRSEKTVDDVFPLMRKFSNEIYIAQGSTNLSKSIKELKQKAIEDKVVVNVVGSGKIEEVLSFLFDEREDIEEKDIVIFCSFSMMKLLRQKFGYNDEFDQFN